MPYGNDMCTLRYIEENAAGEIHWNFVTRFAILSGCRLNLNCSGYGLEAGLYGSYVSVKTWKCLERLSNYQLQETLVYACI